jgi:hypothetical protein
MTNHQSPNLLSQIANIISPYLKTKHKDTVSVELAQKILDLINSSGYYDPS